MNTPVLIAIVAIVVVVAPVAFIVLQKRRTQALKYRFGLEYDRAIKEHGDKRKAAGGFATSWVQQASRRKTGFKRGWEFPGRRRRAGQAACHL
jgi:hypothetical protein